MSNRYSIDTLDRAKQLWAEGKTISFISLTLGITERQLRRWREKHPFPDRPNAQVVEPASPSAQEAPATEAVSDQVPIDLPKASVPGTGCIFPLWPHNARQPTFEYCDAVRKPGCPYCAVHASLCYEAPTLRKK